MLVWCWYFVQVTTRERGEGEEEDLEDVVEEEGEGLVAEVALVSVYFSSLKRWWFPLSVGGDDEGEGGGRGGRGGFGGRRGGGRGGGGFGKLEKCVLVCRG